MKRKYWIILALAAMIGLLCCGTAAADDSGTCGANVTYSFNSTTGVLTISGTGAMTNYTVRSYANNVPWYNYGAQISSIVIENGVTSIGDYTFTGCSIVELNIPSSVNKIGSSAFINCGHLTTVTVMNPNAVFGGNVFSRRSGTSGLLLKGWANSTAQSYAESAGHPFESLGSLSGSWGDNVTYSFAPVTGTLTISGTGEMASCSATTDVPWYGYRDSITSVTIGSGVTNVGSNAFYYCTNLTSVTIPDKVTSIGIAAFYGCTGLTSVTIPASVTRIDWGAFKNDTGLTSVTILNPYCVIGDSDYDVFKNCASGFTLRGYSGSTAEAYAANTVNPCAFESLGSQSIQTGSCGDNVTWTLDPNTGLLTISGTGATYDYDYLYNPSPFDEKTNITSAVFSTGITRVGSWLLNDCVNLTSVSIPATVETIGEGAFYACGLTELTIPEGVTVLETWAFNSNTQLSTLLLPDTLTTIGVAPFANCSSLANVTIPDSVTSIGDYAFYGCTSLTSITIPDSVTSIGSEAFYGCTSLTSVTILNPICVIGDSNSDVFNGCSSGMVLRGLTNSTAYLYAQAAGITFESLGTYTEVLTGSCGENLTYSLDTGIGMLTITGTGEMAHYSSSANVPWYGFRSGITSVSIGSSVTSIGDYAFCYCTGLTGITIPDSVTSIGDYAFYGCTGLTSITIPGSVTSIGKATFANCTGLTSVTIPNSVMNIGDYAFYYCTGLTGITIPDSVTSIGYATFYHCTGLTSVTISDSVTSIGRSAFLGCIGLTSITIPGSVTRIYVLAFEDCFNLADVTILNPTCVIGDSDYDVFKDCASGFTLRGYSGSTAETYANAAGIDFEPIPTAAFVLPAALTTIESEAFSGIAAEAVLIPASVISISGNPFAGSSVHYIYGSTDLVRNFAQAYGYVFVPIGD